jgi:NDP-mannose synthase
MPVGEMPILEILIRRLKASGVTDVTLAVGYLASLIMAYFAKGERLGLTIGYSMEDTPLGTAGPLRLVPNLTETFLVMNGDLLTDLDFDRIIDTHRRSRAALTLGIYERDVKIDLGVIETDGDSRIKRYIEKPVYHYQASMGVYVMEPRVLEHIPAGMPFDLPALVQALISNEERVVGYKHTGYWLDIGREDDYRRAQAEASTLLRDIEMGQ